jgi:hypothetical protein
MAELAREFRPFGVTVKHARGGHLAFVTPSGATVFGSSTPSDWRFIHHIRAKIRRALRGATPIKRAV